MRLLVAAFLCLLALPALAGGKGEGPPGFEDRPQVGRPLRFVDAAGNTFTPAQLYLVGPAGTLVTRLPAASDEARSEDRIDLSGLPLIGQFFPERLGPGDARLEGEPVGPLYRLGPDLLLESERPAAELAGREVILTVNLPRAGPVSYRLGTLPFAPATQPAGERRPAGVAYLVGEALVLAGPGREALIDDWDALFRENF